MYTVRERQFNSISLLITGALLLLHGMWQTAQAQTSITVVSAASYQGEGCAPESIAAAFGTKLATTTAASNTLPLPTTLGGTTVKLKDSAGTTRDAQLFFVSPTQINFLIPTGTVTGTATLTVRASDGVTSTGTLIVAMVTPSIFTANATGRGVPAASFLRIKSTGQQTYEAVGKFNASLGQFAPLPVDLGPAGEQVFLVLYGTGLRFRSSLPNVTAKVGSVTAEVMAAAAQGSLVGLDQVNLRMPRNLPGCGTFNVSLSVDGKAANMVQVAVAGLPMSPPNGLVAASGNGEIALSWSVTPGATSYQVKRATTSNGTYSTIATVTAPSHIDKGLANGTAYFYTVSAVGCSGESANSNQATATPLTVSEPVLYLANLTPEGQAQSGGSGVSTLLLSTDETKATIKFNYANLTTAQMAAHVHGPADPGQSGAILFDLDDSPKEPDGSFVWTFTPAGTATVPQIVTALKTGRLYVNIHSSKYPGGEIRGHFRLAGGSQTFTPPAAPPPLPSGTPSPRDAGRLLTQATFGPTLAEINRVQQVGYANWINEQFTFNADSFLTYLDTVKAAGRNNDFAQVMEAFWKQGMAGKDQLRGRVAFALSEILVVSENGVDDSSALAGYYDVLNRNAFGNFRTLLKEVTLHPAMGKYLDMVQNDKEDPKTGREPNENYAREILQLFSIGLYQLNPDGSLKLGKDGLPIPTYDQATVENFAKVFTGWNYAGNRIANEPWRWTWPTRDWRKPMEAWPDHHSTGEKTLLNGKLLPANQTPEKDLDDAIDNIFNHPNVGPFICRQLIQRLVTSNPSPGYLYRVARVFDNNGSGVRGDLKAVVRAILTDYEARSLDVVANHGFGKQREPVLRFSAVARLLNLPPAAGGYYPIWNLNSPLWGMGQNPLLSPTVFNFFEPNYSHPGAITQAGLTSPEFQITNETSIIGSTNTLRDLSFRGHSYDPHTVKPDYSALTPLAATPEQLVDRLNLIMLSNGMSSGLRTRLLAAINSIRTAATDYQTTRVKNAVWLIALSPEFAIQK